MSTKLTPEQIEQNLTDGEWGWHDTMVKMKAKESPLKFALESLAEARMALKEYYEQHSRICQNLVSAEFCELCTEARRILAPLGEGEETP